ncbi:hypothetical protein NQ318_012458 [Aromia moschata]|uniref:Transient receptor potential cation channel protein painless n=1 Tax=Aromia moschata TaxID=1265417 RepID=A0AAV8X8K7_9CUCU|nr:hypothetical protein NQ318_012458 [Aromia moschata]
MYEPLTGRKEGLMRTNSICPSPESVLLELVKKNERENIVRFIEANPKLLDYVYSPEYNKPILLIACSEDDVEPATVKTLIDLGADLHYSSEIDEEWQALHFAACHTRSAILRVIIENLRNPGDINATAKGSNALHVLIKHGRTDLTDEFGECAKILVQQGINVNLGDSNGVSPILWAAKRGYKDIIKTILENSVVPVDLDSHQSRRKTARDIITSENLYDGPLPEKCDNNNETDENILFRYLQCENESAFINYKNGDISGSVNADNSHSTLLQTSCYKHLRRAVDHLMKSGANPNLTTKNNRQLPIELAAECGCYEIFETLLSHRDIRVPKSVLVTLLKYTDNEQFFNVGISHAECYKILLKHLERNENLLDINEVDDSQNSPLHYAVRYADSEKVEELLQLGASLGCKNKFGVMPVQDIGAELLEKHLNSCVEFDRNTKKYDKEDFQVTFNYRTLIPPLKKPHYNVAYDNSDPETSINHIVTRELVAETEVISYMSRTPEFKYLLQHPVIVSFLFMKWHRIRCFYILFTDGEPVSRNETEGGEDEDFFTDPGRSVFKTIVMLTGEFDAGSLNFQHFPVTSKLIFSLFVFMIAIILLNLLNGLAVSDTQMIKNNAELVGHISRAQHIQYVESMALGNILPSTIIKAINGLCCCFPQYADHKFSMYKPLAKRVCLFPHYLDYKLTFYPNKYGEICLPVKGKKRGLFARNCYDCSHIYLDKETVKRTTAIVQQRREEEAKVKQEDNHVQKIDDIIQRLKENAASDRMEIFILNKKAGPHIKIYQP